MNTLETPPNHLLEQDYILLIMNCMKYRVKALQQKKDWIQRIPPNLPYYHVIGNTELTSDFTFDNEERILWVKTKDDYNSLPSKVVAAYAAIQETFTFKYIFKTDDDQLLSNDKFFKTIIGLVETKKPKIHYGGQLVNVEIPYLSKYYLLHPELPQDMIIQATTYCSGRFYLLSMEAVANIVSKKENISKEFLEDYAIGLHLHSFFKKVILPISSDKYFKDMEIDEDLLSWEILDK